MNVNRLDKWDREDLREYVEAMEHAGHHAASVPTSDLLGMLDDLDKVPALVEALRRSHPSHRPRMAARCTICPILAEWEGIA